MDPQVSASFIPKKPLAEVRGSRGGAYGVLMLLSVLIFIASLIAAGSAFLYQRYQDVLLASHKATLEKYQQSYEIETIQTLIRFDSRIAEAKKVLTSHLAPSEIFSFLAEQTLEKVQFTDFSYQVGATGHSATIQMSGLANSFATIALQSDQLGGSKVLKDIIFSNITIHSAGEVSFSVSASVDQSLILYRNSYNKLDTQSDTEPTPAP